MLLWQCDLPRFIKNTPYFLKYDYRYTLKKKHSQFYYVQHTIAVAPCHITCHPNQDAVLTVSYSASQYAAMNIYI